MISLLLQKQEKCEFGAVCVVTVVWGEDAFATSIIFSLA